MPTYVVQPYTPGNPIFLQGTGSADHRPATAANLKLAK